MEGGEPQRTRQEPKLVVVKYQFTTENETHPTLHVLFLGKEDTTYECNLYEYKKLRRKSHDSIQSITSTPQDNKSDYGVIHRITFDSDSMNYNTTCRLHIVSQGSRKKREEINLTIKFPEKWEEPHDPWCRVEYKRPSAAAATTVERSAEIGRSVACSVIVSTSCSVEPERVFHQLPIVLDEEKMASLDEAFPDLKLVETQPAKVTEARAVGERTAETPAKTYTPPPEMELDDKQEELLAKHPNLLKPNPDIYTQIVDMMALPDASDAKPEQRRFRPTDPAAALTQELERQGAARATTETPEKTIAMLRATGKEFREDPVLTHEALKARIYNLQRAYEEVEKAYLCYLPQRFHGQSVHDHWKTMAFPPRNQIRMTGSEWVQHVKEEPWMFEHYLPKDEERRVRSSLRTRELVQVQSVSRTRIMKEKQRKIIVNKALDIPEKREELIRLLQEADPDLDPEVSNREIPVAVKKVFDTCKTMWSQRGTDFNNSVGNLDRFLKEFELTLPDDVLEEFCKNYQIMIDILVSEASIYSSNRATRSKHELARLIVYDEHSNIVARSLLTSCVKNLMLSVDAEFDLNKTYYAVLSLYHGSKGKSLYHRDVETSTWSFAIPTVPFGLRYMVANREAIIRTKVDNSFSPTVSESTVSEPTVSEVEERTGGGHPDMLSDR